MSPEDTVSIVLDANVKGVEQFYGEKYVVCRRLLLLPGKKTVLPSPDPRVCRFCGRDNEHTQFRQDAHAIPQLLGNRTLFTREECDCCNLFFGSTIEDDLGKWTMPSRTISRIKGKNGVPTIKHHKEGWRIEYDESVLQLTDYESNPKFNVDIEKRQFSLQLKRNPYTPVAVLKALVRIGLMLLPNDELTNFSDSFEWVRNPDHTQPFNFNSTVFCTFQPGPMPSDVIVAILFRRKPISSDVPYAFLYLAYGNEIYQVFLPSPRQDCTIHGKVIGLPAFPIPHGLVPQQYAGPKTRAIDLGGRGQIRNDISRIVLGFEHVKIKGPL